MRKTFSLLAALLLPLPAPAVWEDSWEKIPATQLPKLAPDGELKDFRLALARAQENCREARAKKFHHCGGEGAGPELVCDEAVLARLDALARAKKASWTAIYEKAKAEFDWYRYKNPPEKVLFTGYNSPLFEGSLTKTEKYRFPLYGKPRDLVTAKDEKGATISRRQLPDGTLVPHFTRREIDVEQKLAGQKLEIAWFEFPTDILRLQIEGSGILRYREKGKIHEVGINYAGKNGQPYVSIFKTLKEEKADPKYLSFPGLKQYFLDHPKEFSAALEKSPSFVFFALATEPPCGTARVHVTGGHTLATDPTQLPLGLLALFEAERPVEGTSPDAKQVPTKLFTRFAVAQDTGGAIKGAHVDVYWGSSDYAMLASNTMKTHGSLYLPRAKRK